ncbi:Ig-like domain-containing protein [Brevibacillus formosus]|uniref:Ig-like domain-containing protein n=1 Tax=Brevibacillus formosus TaxID=54913 RepID=UPI003D24BB63
MNKKVVLSVLSTTLVASLAASAFAAPKDGIYIGGDIKKFYSTDVLFEMTPAAKTAYNNELKTMATNLNNVVFVDYKGNGASLQEMFDKGGKVALGEPLKKEDFADLYKVVNKDGSSTATENARDKVDGTTPGELKVESVSAINGTQLQVKFGAAVDKNAAESETNYTIKKADGTTLATTAYTAVLVDEKTVVITLVSPITTKTTLAITVQPIAKDGDSNVKTELYSTTLTVEDKVAPTVSEIKAETNGSSAASVTVKFSEPVQVGATFKVDGVAVAGGSVVYTDNNTTVTLNNLTLAAGSNHTLDIVGLLDAAGNTINPNPTSKTFTVSVDANAPVVSSVEAYGDKAVVVTFSKKMNATTVTTAGNITLKDEALNPVNVGTVAALAGDTTGTKFVVPVNTGVTLYSGAVTSRNLTVVFTDNLKDNLGNKVAVASKSVTLNKDVTAPTVASVSFVKDSDDKLQSVTVEFSEAVGTANPLSTANFSVVDQDGVDQTAAWVSYLNATPEVSGKKVTYKPTTAAAKYGQYTLSFKQGLVKDTAENANNSAAFSKAIDLGTQATGEFKLGAGAATYTAATQVIEVNFGRAVKGGNVAGSATEASNYTLNGVALPAGSVVLKAASSSQVAVITIPAEFIPANDSAAVFRVANVQDSKGVTVTPYVATLDVKDNKAPVLESARVLDNDTIELTFNENMAAASAASVGDEFVIYEGTTAKTLTAAQLKASSVAGYAKKLIVDLSIAGTPGTPASATVGGANASIASIADGTTATADATHTYTVEDNGTALEVKEGTAVVATLNASGDGTFTVDGVTVAVTGAANTNTFTVTTTAPVAGTPAGTFDLTKDLSIKSVAVTGGDVKDASNNNVQKDGVTVTISK